MDLLEHLRLTLQARTSEEGECPKCVLAISGGVDSMVLLDLFSRAVAPQFVRVAHYQHGVRGLDAESDALFVADRARALGIECVIGRRELGLPKDEASLRQDRLAFLEEQRRQFGAHYTVTAHHADDQLETFLMRLIRGTGLEGLGSMSELRGTLMRPLLGISKAELLKYAHERSIEFRQDASNLDDRYLRNRVRSQALPVLSSLSEAYGGPEAFLSKFGDLTEELRETEKVLDEHTRSLAQHVFAATAFWTRGDQSLFLQSPNFWRRRLLRRVLKQSGVATLDRADIDRAIEFLHTRSPAISLAGFRLIQSCGYFYVQTPEQSKLASAPRLIEVDGETVRVPDLEMTFTLPSANREVRFFRPGDQIRGEKLKDFFLTHRIPWPERALLPVLAVPGENTVEWIFPQAHPKLQMGVVQFPFAASVRSLGNSIGS